MNHETTTYLENDEIELLMKKIIKTPQFQRLKNVKQLGVCYIVFPSANHTRYDHCIGTFYAARKMLEILVKNTPNLVIPLFYQKCVCIAALLHDIGHGPFSHFWEVLFPKICHEKNCDGPINQIFNNNSNIKLSQIEVEHEKGIQLIKSFIIGENILNGDELKYKYLNDIVNNKTCSIDVDKWDYLKRDWHHATLTNSAILGETNIDIPAIDQIFQSGKVSGDGSRIIFAKSAKLFQARFEMHINVYQKPIVKALEKIIEMVRKEIPELPNFYGKYLHEVNGECEEFLKLTDTEVFNYFKKLQNSKINRLIDCFENNKLLEIPLDENHKNNSKSDETIEINIKFEYPDDEIKKFYVHKNNNNNNNNNQLPTDNTLKQKLPKHGYYVSKHLFVIDN